MARLRIAYFGLPLGALLLARDGHDFSSCVLSPIAAPGRRRLLALLGERAIEATQAGERLTELVEGALAREQPDLLVSWFWTRRLPEAWLARPRLDAIGVHPSLLPRHRGPNPFFWAIDAGDAETGVSVHRLEPEYDTGPVLDSERLSVGELNSWQLARALDRPSLRALRRTVAAYAAGHPPEAVIQRPELVTAAPEPTGSALRADFRWPSARILRRIRALSPVPGLALAFNEVRFFVTAACPTLDFVAALQPGEAELRQNCLILRTGDGAIAVERATYENDEEEAEVLDGAELAARLRRGSGPAPAHEPTSRN